VLGGTQSLHTNSFDEAIALPTDGSARIARNTQLILSHETQVTRTVDPLGGSYYVEALTHSLAAAARKIIARVDAKGGIANCVDEAKLAIEESAARRQARIDKGEDVIVGVNKFEPPHEDEVAYREVDNAAVLKAQLARLTHVKAGRDPTKVAATLAALHDGAAGEANLLALAIDAARARATVGEISDAIEMVHARHRATTQVISGVYGGCFTGDNEFAALQGEVETYAKTHSGPPRILIAKIGQDGHDRGAKVIASAYADIGFAVDVGDLFATPEEVAAKAVATNAQVVGVSSLAAGHKTLVPELIAALKAADSKALVVVGGVIPPRDYDFLKQQGVAAIFGPGSNIPEAAKTVLELVKSR
jgi:methylmalonyl-CoA mutase